jgi:hypothetical protein
MALFASGALALAAVRLDRSVLSASSARDAVANALAKRGLACDPADVVWIDAPRDESGSLFRTARAIAVARSAGEPTDLYLVESRVTRDGKVLEVGTAHDLSDTSGVDESRPLVRGRFAVYATSADGVVTAVHVLDFGGRSVESYADLRLGQRVRVALTNLQQTGQTQGVVHATFALEPMARRFAMDWKTDGTLEVQADDHRIAIVPAELRVTGGNTFVRVVPDERARPGNWITWAVDRLRAMNWFGDDRMQWLKAVVFTALDKVHATLAPTSTAEDVSDELGISAAPTSSQVAPVDVEAAWPPAPMTPAISPALPGEGRWIPLDHDPFITPTATGAAPPFVTAFVRPSAERPDVRVYATLWDPRRIALHIEAGTVEPISATGEHGLGMVARTPAVMGRLVAAFNGGSQAQHGEYGMQANGIEYLPPKPYAATVLELRDGSSAFGAWPSAAAVPDDVVGARQNLTALVQGGRFNPWGRTWWGGTPPGWADQVHTTRSGICLTKAGFVGYFYSVSISAEDLGRGMLAADCSFGIHLDMNPGHSGFEFYNVASTGALAPLDRRLQPAWEAEGTVSGMPGYVFRSRRMIRGMGHMLFPRYIQREARDFFYLTIRPTLPGAPLAAPAVAAGAPNEETWQTQGLPQFGFPPAIASTSARLDARTGSVEARVLRVDPKMVAPVDRGPPGAPTVMSWSAPTRGDLSLWWSAHTFAIAPEPPDAGALALASGHAFEPNDASAHAAVGVQDDDGMLLWIDLPPQARSDPSTTSGMNDLLLRAGCSHRIFFSTNAQSFLAEAPAADAGSHGHPPPITARLVRDQAPGAHLAFPETPIVPIQVWQPLQAKRVRYFLKPKPAQSSSAAAASAAPDLERGAIETRPRNE